MAKKMNHKLLKIYIPIFYDNNDSEHEDVSDNNNETVINVDQIDFIDDN